MTSQAQKTTKRMNCALWFVQALLAVLFLWAGGMKLLLPIEQMTKLIPLPGLLLRFIGTAEVLGAFGLILPGLLRIGRGLTPLAAAGLAIVMTGAAAITLNAGGIVEALLPAAVGLLAAWVARCRRAPAGEKEIQTARRSGEPPFDLWKEAA